MLLRVVSQSPASLWDAALFEQTTSREAIETLRAQWLAMQHELAALSSQSRRLAAASTGRDLPLVEPDLVTGVIAETVWAVRVANVTRASD